MSGTGDGRLPRSSQRGDAALDAWLRRSLKETFDVSDEVPEALMRLVRQVGEQPPS